MNTKDNLDKFGSKTDKGIFLGYSTSSKAYRVINKRTLVVEESINDEDWVLAMQEELNQIERNNVWTLVLRPKCNALTLGSPYILLFR